MKNVPWRSVSEEARIVYLKEYSPEQLYELFQEKSIGFFKYEKELLAEIPLIKPMTNHERKKVINQVI